MTDSEKKQPHPLFDRHTRSFIETIWGYALGGMFVGGIFSGFNPYVVSIPPIGATIISTVAMSRSAHDQATARRLSQAQVEQLLARIETLETIVTREGFALPPESDSRDPS
ncbi:MAG: hypothetical protein HC921_14860 [Synechococcaceae cyanobacterium SM2_3_1]|nr:hypothetical protein [Synechococcaceae cyanobacterium SM2_3_1]